MDRFPRNYRRPYRPPRFKGPSQPRPKWIMPAVVCFIILLVMGAAVILISNWLPSLLSNRQTEAYHTHFNLGPNDISVVLHDQRVTDTVPPIMENDVVYLPVSFLRAYIDPFILWDSDAQELYVSTPYDTVTFFPGALDCDINGETRPLERPVTVSGGEAYMPAQLVEEFYPYRIEYQDKYKIVTLENRNQPVSLGQVTRVSDLRYWAGNDSPIAETISPSADSPPTLRLYGEEGEYTRVRTWAGLVGYLPTADLETAAVTAAETLPPAFTEKTAETSWPAGNKINLLWDVMANPDANVLAMENPLPEGVDVVSPTWFNINAETLEADAWPSREYVEWAHAQNCQVWPLLADESGQGDHNFLTSPAARRRAVQSITDTLLAMDADGLNIDLEQVETDDGPHYIQFVRELSAVLRREGLTVSADVFVPMEHSAHYRRDLLGKTVDFVCVMTYDEHYTGSPASGPVASLPFVEKGIQDSLLEVPAEKLLMCLPFYNRIWIEVVGEENAENRDELHYNTDNTLALFSEHNAEFTWEADTGYYYGEFAAVEDGVTKQYRVWLEDESSIARKLDICDKYGLAGVACWSRGYNNSAIQALLRDRIK